MKFQNNKKLSKQLDRENYCMCHVYKETNILFIEIQTTSLRKGWYNR